MSSFTHYPSTGARITGRREMLDRLAALADQIDRLNLIIRIPAIRESDTIADLKRMAASLSREINQSLRSPNPITTSTLTPTLAITEPQP